MTIGEQLPLQENIRKERTGMLAEKLALNKHDVLWWTSAFNHFQKKWFFQKDTTLKIMGFTIKALKGIGYKKNISLRRFIDHRIIACKFKKIAPALTPPDIILAATPSYDLAYEAVVFAKSRNIPVLVDIRDEWPDLFLNALPRNLRKFLRRIMSSDFRMIKKILQGADGLIAMMNSLLDWGLNYAGRPKSSRDRIFYLGNKKLPPAPVLENTCAFLKPLNRKFIVTFIGTFVQSNNPSILIECAEKLSHLPIHFVLAGDGELFPQIQKKAAWSTNILLPGWLNQAEMSVLLKTAHVGVCPTTKIREAFPNKAFAYLSAGLPVLSAFQGDIKDIIEKYQVGFYFPPNDVDALSSCIIRLYQDRVLYQKMAENARKIFDEIFDADKIYDQYARYIEIIANQGRTKTP